MTFLSGCAPTFEGLVISFRNKTTQETTTTAPNNNNKRQAAASANTTGGGPQVKTFLAHNNLVDDYHPDDEDYSGLGALEVPRGDAQLPKEPPTSPATSALKSSTEMLRSILSPPSAASILSPSVLTTYEEIKKSTASTYEELKTEVLYSTASRTASPSNIFSPTFTNRERSRPAAVFFPSAAESSRTASSSPAASSRATTKKAAAASASASAAAAAESEGQSLLSRSQARRMKLRQCYSEIMKNASPTSIKEQHEQYQQQQQQQKEGRDDETASSRRRGDLYATIKSPRVRALYEFDIRDGSNDEQDGNNNNDEKHQQVEEDHQDQQVDEQDGNKNNIDAEEHQQEVEEYTQTHHDPPSNEEVDEWEAAQVRRGHRTCALDLTEIEQFTQDVRKRIQLCSPKVNDDGSENEENKKPKPKNFQELVKEFEEEWRREPKKKTSNLSHSDIKKKKKEMMTASSSSINEDTTAAAATAATRWKALQTKPHGEYYGEKEIPDDMLEAWWKERQQSAKKSLSASERFDIWWKSQNENKKKELFKGGGGGSTATLFRELEGEPTVEVDVANKKKISLAAAPSKKDVNAASTSQSTANNVASGTLKVVLSRVDEAKEQFVKALEDNDVKRQKELAALLAQLGEAAAAMRKLEEM